MGDRVGLISEPIFCKACAKCFATVAKRRWDEVVKFRNGARFVAGSMQLTSYNELLDRAADMVDELRFLLCHPVRFALIGEFKGDKAETFVATPYTRAELAHLEEEKQAPRTPMHLVLSG